MRSVQKGRLTERRRMNTTRSRDGTTIAFDRSGEGPPIILVGGAFTVRSSDAPLAEQLERHFTVFTYDRRGRGSSEDTAPYAVDREIEDLEALIVEAGGSATVYGKSSGAALALEAAARGLPITGLALFEPPFIVDDSRPRPPADLGSQLSELTSAGRRGDAVELFITKAVGLPVEAVAQMRTAPMWPGLEAQCATPHAGG
jgi:pimeloyl-ACP methyl ester carboxylesterase